MVPFENALFSSPEGRSFNSIVPMPFRHNFRMVVTNESDIKLDMFFYEVDWTLGDEHGPDALWLHAHWRRENPTTLRRDYEFLPQIQGRGRLLGVNFGVIGDLCKYHRTWWGEGEVKIFLDGDTQHPTLCGTGTEDYIGTGWDKGATTISIRAATWLTPRECSTAFTACMYPIRFFPTRNPGLHPADRLRRARYP